MRKRLVSLLLTTCLAIGLVSTTALAKDETLSKTVTTYRANLYGGCYQTTVNVKVTDIPEDGTLEGKTVDDLLFATESVQYTDAVAGRYSISLVPKCPCQTITSVTSSIGDLALAGERYYFINTCQQEVLKKVDTVTVTMKHTCIYGDPIITEPTETEPGSIVKICICCGHKEVEVLDPTGPTDPVDPVDPVTPVDPAKPADNNNQNKPATTDKTNVKTKVDNTAKKAPKTGDESNVALWVTTIALAGVLGTGVVIYDKKRKHN